MKNVLLQAEVKLDKERKNRRGWQKVVTTLAAGVVFCTTYALILPAITMEQEVICGLEAHKHTDACYIQQSVTALQCSPEAADHILHIHNEFCYSADGTLVCTLPELTGHTHTEACFQQQTTPCALTESEGHAHSELCATAQTVAICTLAETEAHTHTEACYDEAGALVCTLAETEGHLHTESCFETRTVPCALPETEGHTHSEACAATETVLLCELPELQLHTHAEGCFDEAGALICTLPTVAAHQHTAECQPAADAAEMVLICGLDEHEHDETCLPEAAGAEPALICGSGEHTHDAACCDAEGTLLCTIPEHLHEDACWSSYQPEPTPAPTADPQSLADAAASLFEQLPDAEALAAELDALNAVGDRAGYDALLQRANETVLAAADAYSALTDEQKAGFTDRSKLEALQLLLSEKAWQPIPAVTGDSAILTELTITGVEVVIPELPEAEADEAAAAETETETAQEAVVDEAALANEHRLVPNRTLLYHFGAAAAARTEAAYSAGRVRLELVLPLSAEQAAFDLQAMAWLEEAALTIEDRSFGEETVSCQVLTGYLTLTPNETGIAVPGSFAQTAAVTVLDAPHNTPIQLLISAAMEHNAWDGLCAVHEAEEKRTVTAPVYTVYAPDTLVQQTVSMAYLQEIEELFALELSTEDQYSAAIELLERIQASFQAGEMHEVQYESLTGLIRTYLYGDTMGGEINTGTWWKTCTATPALTDGIAAAVQQASAPVAPADTTDPGIVMYGTAMRSFGLRSTPPSNVQIDNYGGEKSADDAVYVSKTIEGTEIENVFDITLQIITQDKVETVYEEPDMAVVIVMDISQTMNSTFGADSSSSRYDAAIVAAENFMKEFQQYAGKVSKIGYVAFNTSAHQIFPLSECSTDAQREALVSTMKAETEKIIHASGYAASHDRFTNIEAGLRMGQNMLNGVNNKNKFVIFLSDGFPTTYTEGDTSTTGYDPYCSKGWSYNDGAGVQGVFYDNVYTAYTQYGTSYSDTAAIRARKQATAMKKAGTKIFSIGVDVGGQTLWQYHKQTNENTAHSVVERPQTADYYRQYGYEIGTGHDEMSAAYPTDAQIAAYTPAQLAAFNAKIADFAQDFKDWLKGAEPSDSVERTGIGSGEGYYYDSDNAEGLTKAYEEIFEKILILNGSSSHLDWVATDPMPGMGVHEQASIEFIAFWDLSNTLQNSLTGVQDATTKMYNENTATFDTATNTISWDLKQSLYYAMGTDDTTSYMFNLKYRVRLMNEEPGFIENQIYDTNDVTKLSYRLIEVKDGVSYIGDRKSIEFPIPAVHGFLAELNFMKTSPLGVALPGAEFTLSHDTEHCKVCRGDGVSPVPIKDQVATSASDGLVRFTNIPSGHVYTLTETVVPDGYTAPTETYTVTVAYDQLTVTVTDADGNPLAWTGTIVNGGYYVLPNTGGPGTHHLVLCGAALTTAAAVLYLCKTGRKRRREAVK